jgi:septum formation protein
VRELEQGPAQEIALHNARAKASGACAPGDGEIVIGCDTVVELDGRIYGKPADAEEADATLRALSARTHRVVSGLVVLLGAEERSAVVGTEVSFRELTPRLREWYLVTGEWRGRAGGYAIQGAGTALVRAVHGDYENVVGLPVSALLDLCPELLSPR